MRNYIAINMFVSLLALPLLSQAPLKENKPNRTFTSVYETKHTSIKAQNASNTCWSFATTSYMESELLRLRKPEIGLSEIFIVRNTYPEKIMFYYREKGTANLGPGGQAHDWVDTVKKHGLVPREVYSGLQNRETEHKHGDLDLTIKAFIDAVIKIKQPLPFWVGASGAILDAYLGKVPANFTYNGVSYTPESFRDSIGLPLDEYVELSSYTHHPFYKTFRLEVSDNWSHNNNYINLPLDELEEVMVNALKNGYSFAWDGDVSEKSFAQKTIGYAFMPKTADQKNEAGLVEAELVATQDLRQQSYDDFRTTDDHLMHVVGLSLDQNGNSFFLTKNSWGTKSGPNNGYVYLSKNYIRMKTLAILVHKSAIPASIAEKIWVK